MAGEELNEQKDFMGPDGIPDLDAADQEENGANDLFLDPTESALKEGERRYDRRLIVNFYVDPDSPNPEAPNIDTNFKVLDANEPISQEDSASVMNQMITIASVKWLAMLSQYDQDAVLADISQQLHTIYNAHELREDGKKFMLRVSKVVEHILKEH